MSVSWPTNVNSDFYGMDASPEENRTQIKYKSGRTIYHRKNSKQKITHAVKLRLEDSTIGDDTCTEFTRFLAWYEDTNCSGTAAVSLTDIELQSGTKDYYCTLTGFSGQKYKELDLTLEEV